MGVLGPLNQRVRLPMITKELDRKHKTYYEIYGIGPLQEYILGSGM